MVVLGGGRFLMSKVPLCDYVCGAEGVDIVRWQVFFFCITLQPRVE